MTTLNIACCCVVVEVVKRLTKEAQELREPTEQFFAQPLDVRDEETDFFIASLLVFVILYYWNAAMIAALMHNTECYRILKNSEVLIVLWEITESVVKPLNRISQLLHTYINV